MRALGTHLERLVIGQHTASGRFAKTRFLKRIHSEIALGIFEKS